MIVASKNSIFIILLEFQKKKVDSLIFAMPFVGKLDFGSLELIKEYQRKNINLTLITRKVDDNLKVYFNNIYISNIFHLKYIRSDKHIYIGSSNLYKSKMLELGVFQRMDDKILDVEESILWDAVKIK